MSDFVKRRLNPVLFIVNVDDAIVCEASAAMSINVSVCVLFIVSSLAYMTCDV